MAAPIVYAEKLRPHAPACQRNSPPQCGARVDAIHATLPEILSVMATKHMTLPRNRICLMLGTAAEEAARFYSQTFPDSHVEQIQRAPSDTPSGPAGDVLVVTFTVLGIPCIGVNGGDYFKHSEAFSFQIATETQEETDRYWDAIVSSGGAESMCGWCRDRWGVSWQITPRTLSEALEVGGTEAKHAFDAMMQMKKIDIATIEAARRAGRARS